MRVSAKKKCQKLHQTCFPCPNHNYFADSILNRKALIAKDDGSSAITCFSADSPRSYHCPVYKLILSCNWNIKLHSFRGFFLQYFCVVKRSFYVFLPGYLFYEFNAFWFEEKPESIMEFNRVKDKFEDVIRQRLSSNTSVLQLKYKQEDTASLSSVSSLDHIS